MTVWCTGVQKTVKRTASCYSYLEDFDLNTEDLFRTIQTIYVYLKNRIDRILCLVTVNILGVHDSDDVLLSSGPSRNFDFSLSFISLAPRHSTHHNAQVLR